MRSELSAPGSFTPNFCCATLCHCAVLRRQPQQPTQPPWLGGPGHETKRWDGLAQHQLAPRDSRACRMRGRCCSQIDSPKSRRGSSRWPSFTSNSLFRTWGHSLPAASLADLQHHLQHHDVALGSTESLPTPGRLLGFVGSWRNPSTASLACLLVQARKARIRCFCL